MLEHPLVSIIWRIRSMVPSLGSSGTSFLKQLLNFAWHSLCWCPTLLLSRFCPQNTCCINFIAHAGLPCVCSLYNHGDLGTVQLWNSCVLITALSTVSWWNLHASSWAYFLYPNLAGTHACVSSAWEENCVLCSAFWSSIHTSHKQACAEMIIWMFISYLKHF